MAQFDFDLFTIGAGSGGVAGSRRAASYGARVGICEDSRWGGTCVIRGCVPKKLLVYGAHFADDLKDAEAFGWRVPGKVFDWPSLIAAKDKEIARLEGIYRRLLSDSGVKLIEGRGRLIDSHTVEVSGKRYTAANILIATGGHPVTPDIPGIEHVLSSNEALDLKQLPKRIVIVGASYIAVEFAGIFSTLGAETHLVYRGGEVLRGFDHDVRAAVGENFRHRGLHLHPRTEIASIEKTGESFKLATKSGGTLAADVVMYATGRVANTKGIGLEEAGVNLAKNGNLVDADEWSRSSVPHIYAVGDVCNGFNLTPVAIYEARALAETLFNNNKLKLNRANIPTAVFTIPPVGSVGLSEEQARAEYGNVDVYHARFRPLKHTVSGRQERTMMKLVVDRVSDRVLGCHMVGDDAPEIMVGLAVALNCGATKKQFDRTIGIHPTSAEEFITMRDKTPEPGPVPDFKVGAEG
jgi:glutathione reductase (NADPH)